MTYDKIALIADLENDGWTVYESVFFDMSHVYCNGVRRIAMHQDVIDISTQFLLSPFGPSNVLDPVWQEALALIAKHTTPSTAAPRKPRKDRRKDG